MASEHQTHDYYMNIGPTFSDPLARQLYAEIASIEEQHVTQYESIIDPRETWLEKWLLHEAGEVYNYWSCVEFEGNPRIKKIWERFLDYELGHLQFVRELFESTERRDAAEILPAKLPDPIQYRSQREFVQEVLANEVDLRARGTEIVPKDELPRNSPSIAAAKQLNGEGSPSELVAAGWIWTPGTELALEQPGTRTNGKSAPRRSNGRSHRSTP
jgi:rubrerythrin